MQILKDENGFITAYALVGALVNGIEVKAPADIQHFEQHYGAYTVEDGTLVFDGKKDTDLQEQAEITDLRSRREKECFPYVNRGQLWYATLTVKQLAELSTWYKAWLQVTTTKQVPERPAWL